MDAILTYEGDGWNRVIVPGKGSLVLFSDGLLNVLDTKGRAISSHFQVKRVEFADLGADYSLDSEKPTP
jgi:hypothetical protein